MKLLSELLTSEALPKLYKNEWTIPKVNAQENLHGRTYYVEPSTLRFFNSRIVSALPVSNGAFVLCFLISLGLSFIAPT